MSAGPRGVQFSCPGSQLNETSRCPDSRAAPLNRKTSDSEKTLGKVLDLFDW